MWFTIIVWSMFLAFIVVIVIKTIQIEVKIKADRAKFDQEMRDLHARERQLWDG